MSNELRGWIATKMEMALGFSDSRFWSFLYKYFRSLYRGVQLIGTKEELNPYFSEAFKSLNFRFLYELRSNSNIKDHKKVLFKI